MKSAVATIVAIAGAANAQVVLNTLISAASATTLSGTSTVADLSSGVLSRGPGVVNNAGGTYNSASWQEGTSLATAVSSGNFLLYSLDVLSMAIDLSTLQIGYDRSNTGPSQLDISVSIDGSAFVSVFTDSNVNANGEASGIIDLTGLDDASTSIAFRIAAWGASSSAGTFDLENRVGTNAIEITGSVVPAPGAAALVGFGGLLAFRRRRA